MSDEFHSKFLSKFEVISDNTLFDKGGFGTLYKVRLKGLDGQRKRPNGVPADEDDEDENDIGIIKLIELNSKEAIDQMTYPKKGNQLTPKKVEREVSVLRKENNEKIEHPNIIKIFDWWYETPPKLPFIYPDGKKVWSPEGVFLIWMEYADLKSLKHWLTFPLRNEADAKILFYQITLGLDYLHGHRIIHRDMKPENVVLAIDKGLNIVLAKIVDFGLATPEERSKALTTGVGTRGYKAPEIKKPGGQYSKQSDVFSLGIIFCQLMTMGRNQITEDDCRNYLTADEDFQAGKFFKQLLNEEEFKLAEQMTNHDPNCRINTKDLLQQIKTLDPEIETKVIHPYDETPWEFRVSGNSKKFKQFPQIPQSKWEILTHLILHKVEGSLVEITICAHLCINLEHIDITLFNITDLENSKNYEHGNLPLPMIKVYKIIQLNMYSVMKYPITSKQIDNLLMFLPRGRLYENKMTMKVIWGQNRIIDIDPTNGSFYLYGANTRDLVGALEVNGYKEKFKCISLNALSYDKMAEPVIQPCNFNRYFPNVRSLSIHDVFIHLDKGKFFERFDNLEEINFSPMWFIKDPSDFNLKFLPKNLKRLVLSYMKVILPDEERQFNLDLLALHECILPEEFTSKYSSYFETVKNLEIYDFDGKSKPGFPLLKEVFATNWTSATFKRFNWSIDEDMKDFVEDLKGDSDLKYIPITSLDLVFENKDGRIIVKQIFSDHDSTISKQRNKYITDTGIIHGEGIPNLILRGSVVLPHTDEAQTTEDKKGEFYFDQSKNLSEFSKFAELKDKSKFKKIVLKNAVVEGFLGVHLQGCKNLEILILQNIRFVHKLGMKPSFPKLKTFQYLEDFYDVQKYDDTRRLFTLEKLQSILTFICKKGSVDLWGSGINILIKSSQYLILELNHDTKIVRIQHVDCQDVLLSDFNFQTEVYAMALIMTVGSIKFVPSSITRLNIYSVDGIRFQDVCHSSEKFSNLKELFYQSFFKTYEESVDLTIVKEKFTKLETLYICAIRVTKLVELELKNLTFYECKLPLNFCEDCDSLLLPKVENFFLIAGYLKSPNPRAINCLIEQDIPTELRNSKNVYKGIAFSEQLMTEKYPKFPNKEKEYVRLHESLLQEVDLKAKVFVGSFDYRKMSVICLQRNPCCTNGSINSNDKWEDFTGDNNLKIQNMTGLDLLPDELKSIYTFYSESQQSPLVQFLLPTRRRRVCNNKIFA